MGIPVNPLEPDRYIMTESSSQDSWELTTCILCEDNPPAAIIWPDKMRGDIRRCSRCKLAFRSPRRREEYQTQHFAEEWTEDRPVFNLEEYRQVNLHTIVKWILDHHSGPGTVLDIGSSYGNLLAQFPNNWQKVGIEPSRAASQICQQRLPDAKIFTGTLTDFPPDIEAYDVITLVDTIYYLHNPLRDLIKIRSLLKPNGFFLVESPNFLNRQYVYRCIGHAFDDTWMFFYTPRSLTQVLQRAGMRVADRFNLPGHRIGSNNAMARLVTRTEFFLTQALRKWIKSVDLVPHFVLVAQAEPRRLLD